MHLQRLGLSRSSVFIIHVIVTRTTSIRRGSFYSIRIAGHLRGGKSSGCTIRIAERTFVVPCLPRSFCPPNYMELTRLTRSSLIMSKLRECFDYSLARQTEFPTWLAPSLNPRARDIRLTVTMLTCFCILTIPTLSTTGTRIGLS